MNTHELDVSRELMGISKDVADLSGRGSQKIWLKALKNIGLTVAVVGGGVLGAAALGLPAFLFSDGVARTVEDETFRKAIPPLVTMGGGIVGLGIGAFYGWVFTSLGFELTNTL